MMLLVRSSSALLHRDHSRQTHSLGRMSGVICRRPAHIRRPVCVITVQKDSACCMPMQVKGLAATQRLGNTTMNGPEEGHHDLDDLIEQFVITIYNNKRPRSTA